MLTLLALSNHQYDYFVNKNEFAYSVYYSYFTYKIKSIIELF